MILKKLYFLFLLCIALSLAACSGNTSVNDAKNGVVCIAVYDAQSNILSWGTGFAIGKDSNGVKYIATNNHVVENSSIDGNTLKVFYAADGENSISAHILMQDKNKDLAIIELPAPIKDLTPLNLLQSDRVAITENVYALGFPGDTFDTATIKGFNRTDITIVNGIISNKIIQNNEKTYQISAPISPGFSGGPLVNADGDVIGINTRILNSNSTIGYTITSDELITTLDENHISYLTPKNFFMKNLKVILITALSLLLILLFLFIYLKAKKNQKLLKIKPAIHSHNQKANIKEKDVAALYINGLTGELANSRFGLTKGMLLFGTDAKKCNVVFKVDANNISGEHCRIELDPVIETFTLTDLNSGNGTYLNDIKLKPFMKEQLRNGDVLYIASRTNMFKIRIEQSL